MHRFDPTSVENPGIPYATLRVKLLTLGPESVTHVQAGTFYPPAHQLGAQSAEEHCGRGQNANEDIVP
jgi:hypothetical protein